MTTYIDYGSYYETGDVVICRMAKDQPYNPFSGGNQTWEQYVNQQVAEGKATVTQLTQDSSRLAAYWQDVKTKRNNLLSESDWTQKRDVNLANDAEWVTYRQQLRDIPQTYASDPRLIVWPIKPALLFLSRATYIPFRQASLLLGYRILS